MSDNVFVDTNILVYAHTELDLRKQGIAQTLIAENRSFISTQVLQELANTLFKKFEQPWPEIEKVLIEESSNNILLINGESAISQACKIAFSYKFSFYDSLIVAAALNCNAPILYTEDMQDGQVIEGVMRIVDPFKEGA